MGPIPWGEGRGGRAWCMHIYKYKYKYIYIYIYIYVKQCVRSTSEMRQYICLCRCQTRVCVKIHVSIWNLTYMSNCEGSRLLACAWVPVCPWIGVVPGCPGQRRAGCMLPKCYTDFVQSRSVTLAGSCSLSFDSPNSLSTLRGSYGRCKGRCLIWVLTLVCGILPVNFRMVWLL